MASRKSGQKKSAKQQAGAGDRAHDVDDQQARDSAVPPADTTVGQVTESAPAPVPVEAPPASDQLLRLRADFENYKRRVLREKDELYRRANEDLMQELLPVLDHLDMAFKAADGKQDDPVVQGFQLVADQLLAALGKHGLQPIEAEGAEFDPNLHEAVSHLPSGEVAENHIMVQTRRGYRLGDRLLRASQVVVSSGAPDTTNGME